jgi:hypothetical protein
MPYYLPHNEFRWINGTSLGKCSNYPNTTAIGNFKQLTRVVTSMTGVVPEEQYETWLKTFKCFGEPVALDLLEADLNCKECVFPYWSSPALTDALTLLALAKYEATHV